MEYIILSVKEIGNPSLDKEWKLNLDRSAYETKLGDGENVPSLRKKIDCHDSCEYWP